MAKGQHKDLGLGSDLRAGHMKALCRFVDKKWQIIMPSKSMREVKRYDATEGGKPCRGKSNVRNALSERDYNYRHCSG